MAEILLTRRRQRVLTEAERVALVDYLLLDWGGVDARSQRAWEKWWKRLQAAELGTVVRVEASVPRLGWFHRMHMRMLQAVYDAQEPFGSFDSFRHWVCIGIGHCDFAPGPDGALAAIPRSIAYSALDQAQFYEVHLQVLDWLRSPRATGYLWPHLTPAARELAVDALLTPFEQEPHPQ